VNAVDVLFWVTVVVHILVTIALTGLVLLQKGRDAGLSGAIAGGAQQMFGKKKGQNEVLSRYTTVLAIVFAITSLLLTWVANKI
jgi:preprotein translocase subunit SecG